MTHTNQTTSAQTFASVCEYWIKTFIEEQKLPTPTNTTSQIVISELSQVTKLAPNTYDSIAIFGVLNQASDFDGLLVSLKNSLKPGGYLLADASSIAPSLEAKQSVWGLSTVAAQYAFEKHFDPKNLVVKGFGNVLVGKYILEEKPFSELTEQERNFFDPYFPILTCIKATK